MTDTAPLTDQQLAEIHARRDAATFGPWYVDSTDYATGIHGPHGNSIVAGSRWGGEASVFDSTDDAIFIAHARMDVPALLAEIDRLRANLDMVRGLHFTRGRNIHGDAVCNECSPLQPMPCPTLRALDGTPDPKTAPEPLPTEPTNAEYCPLCRDRRDLPYPFLCPGHPNCELHTSQSPAAGPTT